MSELIAKKVYSVKHERKGAFNMRVISDDGEWVKGTIYNGVANAILPCNEKYEGDEIDVRKIFCSFSEL